MERLCLWELCEGNLEGGWLSPGDPEEYLEKSLGRVSLYIGAPLLGNLEEGLSAGTLRVRQRGFVSMTPCLENEVLRRKPQSTFCVSVRL
jgi:hypothetical protein